MRNATSLVLTLLIAGTPAWADSRELDWNDLSPFVADHSIALTLPDGAHIKGRVIAVEPEQLVIDVRKTSDARTHSKGRQSIPRDQTKSLVVNRPTIRWRIVGTSLGALGGVPAGVEAAIRLDSWHGGNGLIVAVVASLAAGGFLIGWAADRRKTTVKILP